MLRESQELFSVVEEASLGDDTILRLRGELDLSTQPHFVAALTRAANGPSRLVLDLSDLTFIDAGSIGLINRARNLAKLRGSEVVVRAPNAAVLRILQITGLI